MLNDMFILLLNTPPFLFNVYFIYIYIFTESAANSSI